MSNINEILAKQIADKLKEENLLKGDDSQLAAKLANGSMKEVDWKLVLEAIIKKPQQNPATDNETI